MSNNPALQYLLGNNPLDSPKEEPAMSIHTHKAKEIFDDAKNQLHPGDNPVI
jgi:hypothetical protein